MMMIMMRKNIIIIKTIMYTVYIYKIIIMGTYMRPIAG